MSSFRERRFRENRFHGRNAWEMGDRNMDKIGVIGLGRMGSAMAEALSGAGRAVTGWTRSGITPDRAAGLGIAVAEDLNALAASSDILVLSLFDDAAVDAVIGQLLLADLNGKLIVDTSTVSPIVLQSRAEEIAAAGGRAVDAPISGGPEMVRARTAGFFMGGADADAARFRPVAEVIAGRVFHVGPLGAGMAMKTINNAMLQGYFASLTEMTKLAKRAGLTLERTMDILAGGPAACDMFKARLPKILGQDTEVGFSIAGVRKDADVFLRVARDMGVATPVLEVARDVVDRGIDAGLADADVAALITRAYQDG
nr:NAD(P)-dependent oxidoreductase [Boseongicola sp. H5]